MHKKKKIEKTGSESSSEMVIDIIKLSKLLMIIITIKII
jgi:hypothetical protein